MKYSVLLCTTLIAIFGFHIVDSTQKFIRCPDVRIPNGRAQPRNRGRSLKFNCNPGFTIVGHRVAVCSRGKLTVPPPNCVNSQCAPIVKPDNALTVETYNGGVLMFFCNPGYERQGSPEIHCNGISWNDTVPTCRKNRTENSPTSCDFENSDLCLWEQDPSHDFDWIRHNFNTPSWHIGTGPSYDHTLGKGENGYYLYIEATGQIRNSTARIMSPLYKSNLTEAGCFSFWYHMYGTDIGTLNVYFKVEGETNRTLMFTKSGNQGNHWWQGFFQLPKENDNFQIILEGVRGNGYLSDIAVDDVAILQGNDCIPNLDGTTEMVSTDEDDQVEIVNAMQTCSGRCTYTNPPENTTDLCQCDVYCSDNQNCCPDYNAYCISGNDPMETTVDSSLTTTLSPMRPTTVPNRAPIPNNTKDGIDPHPSENPDKHSGQVTTNAPATKDPRSVVVVTTREPPVTTSKVEVSSRRPITTSTVLTTTDHKFDYEIDTHTLTEKPHSTSSRGSSKVTLPVIIAIIFGAIVIVGGTVFFVFSILQKRNSYKNHSAKSALSDDSDVRFLTSDEILDFNLAKPEDMEM